MSHLIFALHINFSISIFCVGLFEIGPLPHEATFTGNLEAIDWSASCRNASVAHESLLAHNVLRFYRKTTMWTLKCEWVLFCEIAWNWLPINFLVWHDLMFIVYLETAQKRVRQTSLRFKTPYILYIFARAVKIITVETSLEIFLLQILYLFWENE